MSTELNTQNVNEQPSPVQEVVVTEVKADTPIMPEEKPVTTELKPEMNPALSHKERIKAFAQGKKGRIKLNDFLKSLYPIVKPPAQPEYIRQDVMKRLRITLRELNNEGVLKLVEHQYERLGKAHFPDQATGRTHYWDLTNLIIEAEIS